MVTPTMRATTRTTTCLLQVVHSRLPVLRNFHATFSQRLRSMSRESQYLYRLCNPSSSATRSLSTTTAPPPRSRSNPIIPAPTWSLQSLELSQTHTPISDQELSRLTKRAVIDLSALDSHTTNTISKASLAQDLGNMMHMIQQVQSALPDKEMEHLTDADIYDVPRGVTAAPVRREQDTSTFTDATLTTSSSSTTPNKAQLKRPMWWDSLLKPKTTTVGAHSYFAVCTQRDDENKK
jgi:hypothetical protein